MAQDVADDRATRLIPEDVLVHVPGFAGAREAARAQRLFGGTVNSIFRVDTQAGCFVARIHHPQARVLGADHEREAKLHAAAAAAGLAPALVHVDAGYRFMIMEHAAGPLWTAKSFSRPDRLRQLGAALRTLHSVVPPAVAPFDVAEMLARHHAHLREAARQESASLERLMERADRALRACGADQRPRVLIHNDLHHSNLVGMERLYLLDWEYAAVTDPLLDLACVLAYYPAAVPHADVLLDAARLPGFASTEMLRQATWLFVLLSYFWYRSRRLAGPVTPADLKTERSLLKRLR